MKSEPASGIALNVTAVPMSNLLSHVGPQSIPAGALEIVPCPTPVNVTVSGRLSPETVMESSATSDQSDDVQNVTTGFPTQNESGRRVLSTGPILRVPSIHTE